MISIYICDDDEEIIEKYRYLIKKYTLSRGLEVTIKSFLRGEDLLFELEDRYQEPDILFLDIYMDTLNGVDTAKKIRSMGYNTQIIFFTTSSDFVFEAFDVQSFNYLIKQDTDDKRFKEVLSKVLTHIEKRAGDFFECSFGAESRRIPFKDITYFEIYRRVMRVNYNEDEYFDFYGTMDQLSSELFNNGFVRAHRSYLINLRHITLFKNQMVRLSTGVELPIGKAYQSDVKNKFNDFISDSWDS